MSTRLTLTALLASLLVLACTTPGWDEGRDDDAEDDDDTTPLPGDSDGDGFAAIDQGGDDCDDANPLVYPGATENPSNTADDDCDGIIDEEIVITGADPDDGIIGGGTLVTLTGHAFTGVMAAISGRGAPPAPRGGGAAHQQQGTPRGPGCPGVWAPTGGGAARRALSVLDDGTIELVTPVGTVGDVDVTVSHAFDSDTLTDGFRYTGFVTNIDQATLPAGVEQTTTPGTPTAAFYGTVTDAGVTDVAGQGVGIEAEIGLGMQGWDPTAAPDSYSWFPASFDGDDGDGDRYTATITPETYGSYMVTFRFSADGGYNWTYADSDPGTALDPIEMSILHVTP